MITTKKWSKTLLAGMTAILLVFAMVVAGCDNGNNGGNGTEQTDGTGSNTDGTGSNTDGTGSNTGGTGSNTDGTGSNTDGTGTTTTYTVTFNTDGGSSAPDAKTVNSGSAIGTLPTAPTKSGNTFGGWYTSRNGGGTQYTASSPTVTGNITLYAKWTAAAVEYRIDQALFGTNSKSGTSLVFNWTLKTSGKTPNGLYTYTAPSSIEIAIQSGGTYVTAATLSGSARTYTLASYASYLEDGKVYLRVKCKSSYNETISYVVYREAGGSFTPNYP